MSLWDYPRKASTTQERFRGYNGPTLVIHSEFDHIIPFEDGKELFESCGSPDKRFLMIENANHNTIFAQGFQQYMAAVGKLVKAVVPGHGSAQ